MTGNRLNAILNQRSQDILAANNWNVVQYAALVYMMAQVCDMEPGELVHVIADAHIYDRHIPIIKEMIKRETYPAPKVTLNPEVKDFYEFTTDDFKIEDYQAGEQIKDVSSDDNRKSRCHGKKNIRKLSKWNAASKENEYCINA